MRYEDVDVRKHASRDTVLDRPFHHLTHATAQVDDLLTRTAAALTDLRGKA